MFITSLPKKKECIGFLFHDLAFVLLFQMRRYYMITKHFSACYIGSTLLQNTWMLVYTLCLSQGSSFNLIFCCRWWQL